MVTVACLLLSARALWAQGTTAAPADNPMNSTRPDRLAPGCHRHSHPDRLHQHDSVTSFAGWLEKNASLKGTELQDAAEKAGFGSLGRAGAVSAVIQMMVEKPDWTKALGQAVTDKKGVRLDPAAARTGAGRRQPEDHAPADRDGHQYRSSNERSSSRSWS